MITDKAQKALDAAKCALDLLEKCSDDEKDLIESYLWYWISLSDAEEKLKELSDVED